jgi:hypothetical protein
MKTCVNCNADLADDANVCPNCNHDQTVDITDIPASASTRSARPVIILLIAIVLCIAVYALTKSSPRPGVDVIRNTAWTATVICVECDAPINLWQHPATNRGAIVGKIPSGTIVTITDAKFSDGIQYYYVTSSSGASGWLRDFYLQK